MALGELKLWMETAEWEINKIRDDKDKLAKEPCGQFLIVLTISPPGKTRQNVECLLKKLDCASAQPILYTFDTKYFPGGNTMITEGEFAVIGILLKEQRTEPGGDRILENEYSRWRWRKRKKPLMNECRMGNDQGG